MLGGTAVSRELEAGRLSVTAARARFLADATEKIGNTRRDDGVSTVIRSVMAPAPPARSATSASPSVAFTLPRLKMWLLEPFTSEDLL